MYLVLSLLVCAGAGGAVWCWISAHFLFHLASRSLRDISALLCVLLLGVGLPAQNCLAVLLQLAKDAALGASMVNSGNECLK